MGRKSKFEEGLERGRLEVISRLDSEIRNLEGSKKVLDKLRDWMWKNYEEYIPNFGYDEPSKYELKWNYIKTFTYRDIDIDVFDDDYGQQYYFFYNGKGYGCGAYNFDYEGCIKSIVDHDLDDICNFAERGFYGAFCKYANWEHTKVEFWFRGELVETFDVDDTDPESVMKIWQECERRLEKLWQDPEFIKMEEERKAKGNLYFSEMIEKEESGK